MSTFLSAVEKFEETGGRGAMVTLTCRQCQAEVGVQFLYTMCESLSEYAQVLHAVCWLCKDRP